jgi:hypothetical protein
VVVDVADSTFTADFEGSDLKLTGGRGSSMVCKLQRYLSVAVPR